MNSVRVEIDIRGEFLRGMSFVSRIDHTQLKMDIEEIVSSALTTYYQEDATTSMIRWNGGDALWEEDQWIRVEVTRLYYYQHKEDLPDEETCGAESFMLRDLLRQRIWAKIRESSTRMQP